MLDTETPTRRRDDEPTATSRRVGVIWSGDASTAWGRTPSVVLDISPDGAKLKTDTMVLGYVESFRLAIAPMGPIDCTPVWQRDGRLGVRFIGGKPSMAQLNNLVYPPDVS
jgi:hypothetical protein